MWIDIWERTQNVQIFVSCVNAIQRASTHKRVTRQQGRQHNLVILCQPAFATGQTSADIIGLHREAKKATHRLNCMASQ